MKGNGKNKIAPIYEEFEISWQDAVNGDMIIHRETGAWDRIRAKIIYPDDMKNKFLTTHGKEFIVSEVMVVRY